MKVEIEIGQMHRFELREALLIYREGRRSFITRHDVLAQKQGPPVLGVAQPLTTAFVENLAESLGGSASAEVLSENILAKSERMIAWWTPRRRRQMFYEDSEGKMQNAQWDVFSSAAIGLESDPWGSVHPGACRKQTAESGDKAGGCSFLESLRRRIGVPGVDEMSWKRFRSFC
jgi:hypothetical protein